MFPGASVSCLLMFCPLQNCRGRDPRTKHPILALALLYIRMAPLSFVEHDMTWKEGWSWVFFPLIYFSHLVKFPPCLVRCQDKGACLTM